jgi:hypothetical protein
MSKMLDPPNEGRDWIALANALGLYELMEGHSSGYPIRFESTIYHTGDEHANHYTTDVV